MSSSFESNGSSKGAEEVEAHLKEKPKILPLPNGPHYLLNDTQALQTMELFKDTILLNRNCCPTLQP
jgi:hypothetical protein